MLVQNVFDHGISLAIARLISHSHVEESILIYTSEASGTDVDETCLLANVFWPVEVGELLNSWKNCSVSTVSIITYCLHSSWASKSLNLSCLPCKSPPLVQFSASVFFFTRAVCWMFFECFAVSQSSLSSSTLRYFKKKSKNAFCPNNNKPLVRERAPCT